MYGLPKDLDLSFLHGKELLQVCIGMHQVILNLEDQVTISVESEYAHRAKNGEAIRYKDCRLSASMLCSLLGFSIITASGKPDGTLTLRFSNEELLEIFDDSKEFESYQIKQGPRLIVV